jgi:hypothetical protein
MAKPADPSVGVKKEIVKTRDIPGAAGARELNQKRMAQRDSKKGKQGVIRSPKLKKSKAKALLEAEKVSIKDLENALNFLKKQKVSPSDFISLVKEAKALESKYGKTYDAILEDYETKIEQVVKATKSLVEIDDLRKDLETRISNQKELEVLQDLLNKNGIVADQITEYIKQYLRLGEFGFDVETVRLIAEEVKRLQFDPKELRKLISSWLTRYRSVNEALARFEAQVNETKEEEAITIARIKSLEQKAEEAQKKIESLENYYARRSESLEAEYKNRERVLDTRYIEERGRAEAELFEILRERDKMRSDNRILKDELEAIKKDIDLARSISTIIRDPSSLTFSQLDLLISEFTRAKEIREKESTAGPSPSSERLIQARQLLVSALRDLSLGSSNEKP